MIFTCILFLSFLRNVVMSTRAAHQVTPLFCTDIACLCWTNLLPISISSSGIIRAFWRAPLPSNSLCVSFVSLRISNSLHEEMIPPGKIVVEDYPPPPQLCCITLISSGAPKAPGPGSLQQTVFTAPESMVMCYWHSVAGIYPPGPKKKQAKSSLPREVWTIQWDDPFFTVFPGVQHTRSTSIIQHTQQTPSTRLQGTPTALSWPTHTLRFTCSLIDRQTAGPCTFLS